MAIPRGKAGARFDLLGESMDIKSPRVIPHELVTGGGNRPQQNKVKDADGEGHLKSRVIKRSLVVGGHRTSVSLEDVFWNEFRALARARLVHLSQLAAEIDSERQHCNLSSAIRLFVFEHRYNPMWDAHQQNEMQNESLQTHKPHR
jgi:predicted DNA-binding ribbon-helix-helix protein